MYVAANFPILLDNVPEACGCKRLEKFKISLLD